MPATTATEPLPPGEVLLVDPGDAGALHPGITWFGGASPDSAYELHGNELEILAGAGADQWGDRNNAPLVLFPIEGDFTARVSLEFTAGAGWEYAGLGIRSSQDPTTWIRITRFRGGPEENEILVDLALSGESVDPVAREETGATSITFEIVRNGDRFTLSYLGSGGWVQLLDDVIEMPTMAELFLVVGTLGDTGASHRFRELIVRG